MITFSTGFVPGKMEDDEYISICIGYVKNN